MHKKILVRLGATAAAVVLSAGLFGAGVASATPTVSDQPSEPETEQTLEQMDQHMAQMLEMLPAEQRADAQRMHEQMRPLMEQMTNGQDGMMTGSAEMGAMMGG